MRNTGLTIPIVEVRSGCPDWFPSLAYAIGSWNHVAMVRDKQKLRLRLVIASNC
ncbi:hypothetical protein VFPPC_16465 [Pochonia chlamydosporia 170]|uniref:Uncharacterized protein n=1 Tax=Pochonia chlamydosporia 170 TaxID=1380566 RepID=A0A179FDF5_METCM|nr:hypothetical protein VFPPC_16465 [Pochonia chlamydosporia 170]OAQ63388.1 hypothetical protein VFPPC_16465 [Pochonia chlamydosporia 170]